VCTCSAADASEVGSAVPAPDLHAPGRPGRGRPKRLKSNAALWHARRLCCPPHSLHFVVSGVGSGSSAEQGCVALCDDDYEPGERFFLVEVRCT
jgi:hypothetical protein